jgi:alkanesulfonate monooxygenase SsuD/methylene tetrahydromethanopterin reductase-like flavin-dependent oxidoreductase (luciferase family)
LSNGRLDLGVGRGVSPAELAFHGVSGEEEAQGRFDEALAILRQGLTSDSVTFDGKYYRLLDAPVTSRPVQRPHPPLWYGTRTPAKARWCARLGMPMMALVPSQGAREWVARHRDIGGINYMALETCLGAWRRRCNQPNSWPPR